MLRAPPPPSRGDNSPGERCCAPWREALSASAAPGSSPLPARACSPLGSRRGSACPCLAGAARRCGTRKLEVGDAAAAGLGEWNAAAEEAPASLAQLYLAGGEGPREGGEGAGPGVHATSASVTPPRPPGWEALRIDGCQHARAAGQGRTPRGEATLESGGGCLKGQSRLLRWSGPGCGTDSDCAAFALSFSVLLLLLVFVFFGYYWDCWITITCKELVCSQIPKAL